MSQQQYYPPQQQPIYGQPQQYTPPMQQPIYGQPQQYTPPMQQPPQACAPQGYGQPPMQQPVQPSVPLADGSIDAFYSQPNTGGGPGVSWKGKPDGYTVQGVVPRDVTNADVTQEVGAPNTAQAGQPQFYRDGRPKFVMAVPLQVPASPEYPEGEARLFVRGQLRDELSRAMGEAGVQGAPTAGSVITVTLVERKQGRGSIPMKVFHVTYTPAGGQPPAMQQPVNQPPQQPSPQPQYAQAPIPQQQYAAPPAAQPVQYAQPMQQAPQVPPVAQAPQQPVAQAAAPMQAQPQMDPQQAALLAKLTGQQPQG